MGSMEDTWKTLFNEHTRAPIYTVSHYIVYLRRFVSETSATSSASSGGSSGAADKKGNRRRREAPSAHRKGPSPPDGIDPLSYFLRKLKLDLKVSYDSFVRDFVSPQNQGLSLLLQLLSNLQTPSPVGGPGRGSSVGGAVRSASSSSSLNASTSPLDDYKKAVTDEYDCLLCVKFCLRVQAGVSQLMEQPDGLHRIATGVQGSSSKARITCLEILTLCLQLGRGGEERVVEAFTLMRLHTGQTVRFKMLVSMLHTRSPSQVLFQVTCLKFFNVLLNACPTGNQRVYLQQELLCAGLDLQFLTQCAEGDGLEYDDLRREIDEWKTRFIDVDVLLRRLKDRDTANGPFWGQEGPVQVSSRVGSVRTGQGVTYFQPEELTGTVHLEYRRGIPGARSRHPNDGSGMPLRKIHSNSDAQGFHDNGHLHGPEADDSDSDFVSVSAQQTPQFRRKYVIPGYSQKTNGRSSQRPTSWLSDPRHFTDVDPRHFVDTDPRDVRQLRSPDQAKHGHEFSNGATHEQAASQSTMTSQRRHSGESIMDAYGLVIHGRDRYGELPGHPGSPEVYSNFKLRYFSTPDIARDISPGHGLREDPVESSARGGRQENGVLSENEDDMVWKSYYPFSKRALYRGLEHATDPLHTTLPLRAIHPPPRTLDSKPDTVNNGQFLPIPAPDYTPVTTPRGSTCSLNAEVARVLHDFENTLRAHEPSRPPSATEMMGPVAFV